MNPMSWAEAAAAFIDSPSMDRLAHCDARRSTRSADEMDFVLQVTWPELGRAARVLSLLERELRRCSRAWQDARTQADEDKDEEVFFSPARYLERLRQHPAPGGTGRGWLRIRDAASDPLTLLLEPEGEVFAVLSAWPVTTLGYCLAALGAPCVLELQEDCRFEGARFAPDEAKIGIYDQALRGRWSGSSMGQVTSFPLEVRTSSFRIVAPHVEENGERFGDLNLLLLRDLDDDSQDCLSARFAMPR